MEYIKNHFLFNDSKIKKKRLKKKKKKKKNMRLKFRRKEAGKKKGEEKKSENIGLSDPIWPKNLSLFFIYNFYFENLIYKWIK